MGERKLQPCVSSRPSPRLSASRRPPLDQSLRNPAGAAALHPGPPSNATVAALRTLRLLVSRGVFSRSLHWAALDSRTSPPTRHTHMYRIRAAWTRRGRVCCPSTRCVLSATSGDSTDMLLCHSSRRVLHEHVVLPCTLARVPQPVHLFPYPRYIRADAFASFSAARSAPRTHPSPEHALSPPATSSQQGIYSDAPVP